MSPLVSDIREYVEHAVSLPRDQNKAEVRIYAALTTIGFILLLVEPVFYLYFVPEAMISKVARLAPSIWCITLAFVLCLIATLPHLCALVFRPDLLGNKWPRRFAAYATFGAAVTWLFLASLALPMDAGGLEWAYALRAVGSIVIGLTYGFSINAQQGREILKAPEQ
jgi:hypothetical protein